MSAPNFRLKGSGWYETDFKSANRRNLADSGEGEKADKAGKEKEKAKADDRKVEGPKKERKAEKKPDQPAKKPSGDDKAA
ncbi:MAG: FmdB family zinc ribbon protein [Gammaproteobacteria bacterium]